MTVEEPKEIMSQEEIDAYLASYKAKEEAEKPKVSLEPETQPEDPAKVALPASNSPEEPQDKTSFELSQQDIDALLAHGEEPQNEPGPQDTPSTTGLSQQDIDALLFQEKDEGSQKTLDKQFISGDLSQSDIDALLIQEQAEAQVDPPVLQLDGAGASPVATGSESVWPDSGNGILSQEEISALLAGYEDQEEASSEHADINPVTSSPIERESLVDSVTNINFISRQNQTERLRQKEQAIIQKKVDAAQRLKNLWKSEQARLAGIATNKGRMTDEGLYCRYEITRADRTRLIVSLSQQTAQEYRFMNPGCCMHRI